MLIQLRWTERGSTLLQESLTKEGQMLQFLSTEKNKVITMLKCHKGIKVLHMESEK